jgi:hypothetical protein
VLVDLGLGANNELIVAGGPVKIDSVATGGVLNTTLRPAARLETSRLMQGAITLGENSRLTLLPGGEASRITSLTLSPGAALDLTSGALVVDYSGVSPAATIREAILGGRGGPGMGASWTGPGITSSTAAAANQTAPESRSVGYAENALLPLGRYTNFRGVAVDDTAILIAYTRTGDANLDGFVNDDDVTIVGATYAPGVTGAHWALGDFDYNGFVDDEDVTLLGALYDPVAGPLSVPPEQSREDLAPPRLRIEDGLITDLAAAIAVELDSNGQSDVAPARPSARRSAERDTFWLEW